MKVWKIYNGKIEVVSFVLESDRIITTGVTLAILFSLFGLRAPLDLIYLVFRSFFYECTWWRLFQINLDIYVFIGVHIKKKYKCVAVVSFVGVY